MPLQTTLREVFVIVVLSLLLGTSYSFIREKGLFKKEERKSISTSFSQPSIIEINEFETLYLSNRGLIIDTRDPFDFQVGHITNAINIPLKNFDKHSGFLKTLKSDTLIITYCDGAQCNSSIEFAAKLSLLGFSNVKVFFGGWQEWSSKNLPTSGNQ